MTEQPYGVLSDLAQLPPVGTSERREWDATIQEVNELYPDWSAINVGRDRLRRETYELRYKEYYESDRARLVSATGL